MQSRHLGNPLRKGATAALVPFHGDHVTIRIANAGRAECSDRAVSLMPTTTNFAAPPVLPPQASAAPSDAPHGAGPKDPDGPCSCGMQNGNRLLTTIEAARYLRVSPEWLEKLRVYGLKNGSPPPFLRLGRFVKYRLSDLDAYIERNMARSTSEHDHSAH